MSKSREGIKYGHYRAIQMDDVNLNRPTQNGEGNVLTAPEMQRPPADSPNDRAAQTLWGG